MNRMKDRLRRKNIKKVTFAILFASLLMGATAYGQQLMEEDLEVKMEQSVSITANSYIAMPPMMYETTMKRLLASQVEESTISQDIVNNGVEKEVVNEVPLVESQTSAVTTLSIVQEETKVEYTPEGFVYNPDIPLPEEHQQYLYKLCQERDLDYDKTLAIMQHESGYDANVISETNDYGYFQINKINHTNLTSTLETKKEPLDPYVNINWGTYMLSDLYNYWEGKGITGDNLDEHVWSSYNKGLGGFKKHGKATTYIKKVREALNTIA